MSYICPYDGSELVEYGDFDESGYLPYFECLSQGHKFGALGEWDAEVGKYYIPDLDLDMDLGDEPVGQL